MGLNVIRACVALVALWLVVTAGSVILPDSSPDTQQPIPSVNDPEVRPFRPSHWPEPQEVLAVDGRLVLGR
jgi:hypothetical protein